MDKNLSQTSGTFDLSQSSQMWIQAKLLWEKTAKQCRLGLCQDADFTRNLTFYKKLDHALLQELILFLFTQVYACMEFPLLILRTEWLKHFIAHQIKPTNQRSWRVTEKPVADHNAQHAQSNSNQTHHSRCAWCISRFIKRETFWFQCIVLFLWRQWSRDSDDNTWQEPTEFLWIGCLRGST